jgi:hypothetical protein
MSRKKEWSIEEILNLFSPDQIKTADKALLPISISPAIWRSVIKHLSSAPTKVLNIYKIANVPEWSDLHDYIVVAEDEDEVRQILVDEGDGHYFRPEELINLPILNIGVAGPGMGRGILMKMEQPCM